ncbi:MAG: sporulation protein [Eubacteriales bacterium]
MKKISPLFLQSLLLTFATIGLILFPKETSAAVTEGLSLCYQLIIPALFPFFILSSLIIDLGLSIPLGKALGGMMKPLFRLNPNCITPLLLGIIGGFPVGAKTALTLYENKLSTKEETERLLGFCSNAGPAFILGVIGAGIFKDPKLAYLLYASHLFGSFAVGILFAQRVPKGKPLPPPSIALTQGKKFLPSFLLSVTTALDSSLRICAFILCFCVLIRLLTLSGILALIASLLPLSPDLALPLLTGFIELSSGVSALSSHPNTMAQLLLFAFFLGWSGISVHCQVLALAQETDLSMKLYFIGNLLQGIFSLLFLLFLWHFDNILLFLLLAFFAFIFFNAYLQIIPKKTRNQK